MDRKKKTQNDRQQAVRQKRQIRKSVDELEYEGDDDDSSDDEQLHHHNVPDNESGGEGEEQVNQECDVQDMIENDDEEDDDEDGDEVGGADGENVVGVEAVDSDVEFDPDV